MAVAHAPDSLDHVLFHWRYSLTASLVTLDRREVVLHRVSALVADLVTELEAVDLRAPSRPSRGSLRLTTAREASPATRSSSGTRCAASLRPCTDDVPDDAVGLRLRILLADVAADPSQLVLLSADTRSRAGPSPSCAQERGQICDRHGRAGRSAPHSGSVLVGPRAPTHAASSCACRRRPRGRRSIRAGFAVAAVHRARALERRQRVRGVAARDRLGLRRAAARAWQATTVRIDVADHVGARGRDRGARASPRRRRRRRRAIGRRTG